MEEGVIKFIIHSVLTILVDYSNCNLIHKHIRLKNIFFDKDGNVKLANSSFVDYSKVKQLTNKR